MWALQVAKKKKKKKILSLLSLETESTTKSLNILVHIEF